LSRGQVESRLTDPPGDRFNAGRGHRDDQPAGAVKRRQQLLGAIQPRASGNGDVGAKITSRLNSVKQVVIEPRAPHTNLVATFAQRSRQGGAHRTGAKNGHHLRDRVTTLHTVRSGKRHRLISRKSMPGHWALLRLTWWQDPSG